MLKNAKFKFSLFIFFALLIHAFVALGGEDIDGEIKKFIEQNKSIAPSNSHGYALISERKTHKEREVFATAGNADCFIINDPRGYLHNYPQSDYPEATAKAKEIIKMLPSIKKYFKVVQRFESTQIGYVSFYIVGENKLMLYTVSEDSLKEITDSFSLINSNIMEIKRLFVSTLD